MNSFALLIALVASAPDTPLDNVVPSIATNRRWDVLPVPEPAQGYAGFRETLQAAGEKLDTWTIHVAGLAIDRRALAGLTNVKISEPFLRVVREGLRRPIDLEDFALFLDDVLVAGDEGLRDQLVWVPSGRARAAGILVHPDDVFKNKPRLYGDGEGRLNIDRPAPPDVLSPAVDGDILGPNWSARFPNPAGENGRLVALARESRTGYEKRVRSLRRQLRAQGCEVFVSSTVRNPSRGYLMWGAFILSRASDEVEMNKLITKLDLRNKQWNLNVPIRWRHPDGPEATIEAAQAMSDSYDVVYATENGARNSNHYGGRAVDLSVIALPRSLTLRAPNGKHRTFNLRGEEQTRDLSLTPKIINWVEKNFKMKKLRSDYPHWNDALAKL